MSKENSLNKTEDNSNSTKQFIGLVIVTAIVIAITIAVTITKPINCFVEFELSSVLFKLFSFDITLVTFRLPKCLIFVFHLPK